MTTVLPNRGHGHSDGDLAAGTVGRTRALPTGRTLAGAFFIAVAAVVVFASWLGATAGSGKPWVIARADLPAGTRLEPGDLATATMTLHTTTGATAFRNPASVDGRILAAPLEGGELIQVGDLVPEGQQPAVRPVTVPVPDSDLSSLAPGQLVDVLVTDGSNPSAPTELVVAGADVLSASKGDSGLVTTGAGSQITLGVSSLQEVEAIVHASQTGTLAVVAGEPSDGSGLGAGANTAGSPTGSPGADTGSAGSATGSAGSATSSVGSATGSAGAGTASAGANGGGR